jgi:TonB-linked SusC/RagA family outer membrane protein
MKIQQLIRYLGVPLLFLFAFWQPVFAKSSLAKTQLRPLTEVLEEMSERYEVLFSYETKLLKEIKVDFHFIKGESLDRAMNRLLGYVDLQYKAIGSKFYVVHPKTKKGRRKAKKLERKIRQIRKLENESSLSFQRVSAKKTRQFRKITETIVKLKEAQDITGNVKDTEGNPLIGATVSVKGTSLGTVTDFDGNFSLSIPSDAQTLMISYIGYESQEVTIANQTVFNIVLRLNTAALEEVIVVGYGTQKKSDVSGSISSIKGEDINRVVTGNATQALMGKASGVRVEINGGAPGAGSNVIIRGTGSLSNQDPLYVIDGIFSNDMSFLNPSDIASIEVLKDAATAAIYGARAGQGVIIITTKKGATDQPLQIEVDASWGTASAAKLLDYTNASEYIQQREQAYQNDGLDLPGNFYDFNSGVDSDIQDASIRTALVQNYGIRFFGGGQNNTYSISVNRLDQEGIVRASDYERTSLRLNTSLEKGKFSLNQSLFFARSLRSPNNNLGRENGHLPVIPIYDENNDGGYAAANTGIAGITRSTNYLGVSSLTENTLRNDNLIGNISGAYEIIDGLSYKLNLSVNYNNFRNFEFVPTYYFSNNDVGSNPVADLRDNRGTFTSTIIENLLTYKKTFDGHSLDLLAGYSEQKDITETSNVRVEDFLSNETRTISAGSNLVGSTGQKLLRNIRSFFGRVNYNFESRYLFSASIRRDGSSNFGRDNRYGVFPSFSLGWNISNEEFFNIGSVDELKLRASWGRLGSDNLAPFQYVSALNLSSQYTLGTGQNRETGVAQIQFSNPDLKWEETTTLDIGVDLSLKQGQWNFTLDYFDKESKDILAELPVNPSSGTNAAIPFNAATIKNNGFEISANYRNRVGAFKYSVTANFSTLNNEVVDLGEGVNPIRSAQYTDENFFATRTEAGFPVAYFYGYQTDGIYQSQAEIDADGITNRTAVPGDFRFVDLNNDGEITEADRTFLGSSIPDFEYGLNFGLEYKGLDFNMFLQGVQGNELWNGRKFIGVFSANGNKLGIVRDAWTPQNNSNEIPRNTVSDAGFNRRASDFFVEDGSYFRLKNISLGYTFPQAIADKISFSKLRAYINVENAFIITNYTGYYPELGRNTRRGDDLFNRGVDENAYPIPRTITFGVQASF